MKLAPILLFVYSRPDHTLRTLEALKKNHYASDSDLIIYSDAAKNQSIQAGVDEVRSISRAVEGFKSVRVIEREKNWGLANSIIDGVTQAVKLSGSVIVVEDDLVTNPHFLTYMNEGLNRFENDERVASIHGFVYPIAGLPETFFIRGADCWGWATWKRAWDLFNPDGQALLSELESRHLMRTFDFEETYPYVQMLKDQIAQKNSSWAIRWYASAFLKDKLTLYPGKTLVKNIGFDQGTHSQNGQNTNHFGVLSNERIEIGNPSVEHDQASYLAFAKFFKSERRSIFKKILSRLKSSLK